MKKTMKIELVRNKNGKSEETRRRLRIDTNDYPDEPCVYVIRYKSRSIPRMVGESKILKIGKASKGFKNRFENYNHQSDMTVAGVNIREVLGRSQSTNARLMHFLANSRADDVVVELISVPDGDYDNAEREMLVAYLKRHGELPPLNFGKK